MMTMKKDRKKEKTKLAETTKILSRSATEMIINKYEHNKSTNIKTKQSIVERLLE